MADWLGLQPRCCIRLRRCNMPLGPGQLEGQTEKITVMVERVSEEEAPSEGPPDGALDGELEEKVGDRATAPTGTQCQDSSQLLGVEGHRAAQGSAAQRLPHRVLHQAGRQGRAAKAAGKYGSPMLQVKRGCTAEAVGGLQQHSPASEDPLEDVPLGKRGRVKAKRQDPHLHPHPTATVNPDHLPATSLAPAHLHGHVAPPTSLPPLQPGELRLCGFTFHPHLAPGVRRAMDAWTEGLGGRALEELDPSREQVQVLGADLAGQQGPGAAAAAATAGAQAPAAAQGSAALVVRHKLSSPVLEAQVAKLLGLYKQGSGVALPEEAPVQQGKVEQRRDEQRGGLGLWAAVALKRSHVLGFMGGYVMPASVGSRFVASGWKHCREQVRAELHERVRSDDDSNSDDGELPTRMAHGWKLLASSYCTPYPGSQGG